MIDKDGNESKTIYEAHLLEENVKLKKKSKFITDLNEIKFDTNEGKLLMAAIAKITTESQTDKTPNEVIEQLNKLANKMDFK